MLLLAIPAIVALYVGAQRRRTARAEALSREGLVVPGSGRSPDARPAAGRGVWSERRRHAPFALFVVALTLLVVALARPSTTVRTPREEGTVIIALDVSNSMRATDVKPSRIEAAKAAARSFVDQQAAAVRIGVVVFGDGAVLVQTPTTSHGDVVAAINRASVGGATAIGQALLTSLDTISGKQITIDPSALGSDEGKVDIGYFGGTAIVAFTDGENTSGVDPLLVAQVASPAGVRIHTVGVGTEAGTTFQYQGFTIATALDSTELKQLASMTDGTYHQVSDAGGLTDVSKTIRLHFTFVAQHTEVTALFCAAALLMLLLGSASSMRWLGRVV
ncbi:MAG: VWA domain-containing protein [Acidimicrobiia bacterium]|nr:VWA domain-containing protein [Acidimicrobiia bacterium]